MPITASERLFPVVTAPWPRSRMASLSPNRLATSTALGIALDGFDVRVNGQPVRHQLRAFLTHRLQRAREDTHENSVARVDMQTAWTRGCVL